MLAQYFYLKCSGVETESGIKGTYSSKVYVSPLVNALDHMFLQVYACAKTRVCSVTPIRVSV